MNPVLAFSDEDERAEEESGTREEPDESGSVFAAIQALRGAVDKGLQDIKNEITKLCKAQSGLASEIGDLRSDVKLLKTVSNDKAGSNAQDIKGRNFRTLKLEHLIYAAGPEKATESLLTWAIIATVVSFVRKMPSLRFWVSTYMMGKLATYFEVLDKSEGFSMLLFSAKNNSKPKLATPSGRMWTFLLRRALRSVLIRPKPKLFRKGRSAMEYRVQSQQVLLKVQCLRLNRHSLTNVHWNLSG